MTRRLTRRAVLRSFGVGAGTVALAACGAQSAQTGEASTSAAASNAAPSAATSAAATTQSGAATTGLPIVTEPLSLTYWVPMSGNVAATRQSFAEMSCYQELQKRTGIQIQFQHPPVGGTQATEQFNLMIASGQYPAIIEWNWLTFPGGPSKALQDGVIVRLNDLIDQHAPNLKKVLDEHPEWRKQIVTDQGDIYCFPFLRGDPTLQSFGGPAVRGDWLEKAGLQSPTTIDEWHSMLQTFKGNDYNGNGQTDEWPFSPWLDSGPIPGFNFHAFIGAWGITNGFYQDNGAVKYGPLQPEYKEFLGTMAEWYKEGLIDPDVVSMDQKAYDAKMTGGQIGSGIMRVGGGIGKFMGLMRDKDPNFVIAATAYPTLNAGDKPILGQRDNIYPGGGSAAITTANQNQVETVKLLDYAYGEDGHMLFNFGVEGVSYTMENGYPTYTDVVLKNPDGLPIVQAMAQHFRANFDGPFVQDKRYIEQYFQLQEQKEAYQTWSQPTNERLMPPVTPTEDESRRFARTMAEVNTRFEEVFTKVLTGAQPIDSWDTFVGELKQLGIEEALQVQQAALDRFNQRA